MPTVSFQILKGYCQKKANSETKIEAHAVPRVGVLWPWYLPTTAGQRLQGLCEVQSGEEDGPVPALSKSQRFPDTDWGHMCFILVGLHCDVLLLISAPPHQIKSTSVDVKVMVITNGSIYPSPISLVFWSYLLR